MSRQSAYLTTLFLVVTACRTEPEPVESTPTLESGSEGGTHEVPGEETAAEATPPPQEAPAEEPDEPSVPAEVATEAPSNPVSMDLPPLGHATSVNASLWGFEPDRVMILENGAAGRTEVRLYHCGIYDERCALHYCQPPALDEVTWAVGANIDVPGLDDGGTYGGEAVTGYFGLPVELPPPYEALSVEIDDVDREGFRASGRLELVYSDGGAVDVEFEAEYCPTQVVERETVEPINELGWHLTVVPPVSVGPFPISGHAAGRDLGEVNGALWARETTVELVLFDSPTTTPCQDLIQPTSILTRHEPPFDNWPANDLPPTTIRVSIVDPLLVSQGGMFAAISNHESAWQTAHPQLAWYEEPLGFPMRVYDAKWSLAATFDLVLREERTVAGRIYLAMDDPAKTYVQGRFRVPICGNVALLEDAWERIDGGEVQ